MNKEPLDISESIEVLNNSLTNVAQVGEWAHLMGYASTREFSRRFLRYHEVRPCKILVSLRLQSIYDQLQSCNVSNFKVARNHCLPDEKALNKFVNYHLGCCPSQLLSLSKEEFERRLEKFGSKVR